MLKHSFAGLCALTLANSAVSAEKTHSVSKSQQTLKECKGPHPMWASMRYTTPEGIGYKTGYTTLEAFFTPQAPHKWVPFLDLRGHVFDNGKLAANAGLGLRCLGNSRVYGMNAYYDYRNTRRQHYNQVAGGLESLGRIWDFRINGYLPVGEKLSRFSRPKFAGFEKHSLLIKRRRDFAMRGANAEIGAHVDHYKSAPLYFAGGPYYLNGEGETAWGGQLRGVVDLCHRYLRIEGNVSYDHFFNWVGQGQLSINIPFGRRWQVEKKATRSCSKTATLYTRAVQRVDRNEIIPVGKQKSVSKAINPTTNKPWVFWFVDNTSSSAGTYEDPFPALLSAQNASSPYQGIYVFPGNGTSQGMDHGIILKNGQILLGAGVSHSIATKQGTVIIPPLASSSPNITNTTGNAVTLANNNTVSGFNVAVKNGHGFFGTEVSNFFSDNNRFIASNPTIDGIHLINPSGKVFISDSLFDGFSTTLHQDFGNGIYVELNSGSVLKELNITGSQFMNIFGFPVFSSTHGANGIHVKLNPGSLLSSMSVSDSQFMNFSNPHNTFGGNGIFLNVKGGACGSLMISNSNFSNFIEFSSGFFLEQVDGHIDDINIQGCSFSNINTAWGVSTDVGSGSINNFSVSDCSFVNLSGGSPFFTGGVGFFISDDPGGFVIDHCNIFNNIFENIDGGMSGVAIPSAAGAMNNALISGNTFSNINGTALSFITFPPSFSSNVALSVVGNSFSGGASALDGYAANIDIGAGTLCLEFIDNFASPSSNPIPYIFTVSSPGTFNRTTGSDNTTNVGQFQVGPGVGAPGSCSQ